MAKEIHTAIVLAAGKGSRMGTETHKQYLELAGRPVLYYSLKAFEECPFIDQVILVTGCKEIEYCQEEIVGRFDFKKVARIVSGGGERYESVYNGLQAADGSDYVYIHDGARPFLSQEILQRVHDGVEEFQACVAAMPVKDTIKISDENGFAETTPDRNRVWMIQTPQVFAYNLIESAYSKIMAETDVSVTDDAMVLEQTEGKKVRLIEGSYQNLKITTPEDLDIAENFVKKSAEVY